MASLPYIGRGQNRKNNRITFHMDLGHSPTPFFLIILRSLDPTRIILEIRKRVFYKNYIKYI